MDVPATASASSPFIPTCPTPSSRPFLQTSTTDSPVPPVFSSSTSKSWSSQLSPSFCPSATQSSAPLFSHQALLNNSIQPACTSLTVRFGFPAAAASPSSTLVLNQRAAPHQNPPTAVLLTNSPTVYQLFPVTLSQTAPCTIWQQKTSGSPQILPAPATTCPSSSSKPLPQTGTTSDTNSPAPDSLTSFWMSLSSQSCLPPSSSSSISPPTSTCPSSPCKPLLQTGTTNDGGSGHSTLENSFSSRSCPPPSSSPFTASSSTSPPTFTCAASSSMPLPHTDSTSDTASPVPDNHLSTSQQTSGPSSQEHLLSDITSSSLKPQQSAVADSAFDCSVQQVIAWHQEPAENEPTSTVSEETEPARRPSEELSSVIGRPDCSLSQWQPRVTLFRLPVSQPRPGHPLPGFSLVPGEEEDEIYLKEISEDSEVGHHL